MKPVAFDFSFATDATTAAAMLASGGSAKPIAGGQSLGPMLNLRLARPRTLVDLSRAADMRGVTDEGDAIVYGGAVTHAEIEDGVVPDATPGWLAAVARRIAYRAVRNRGTIGGSLAHADPAADWVNVLTALGAEAILVRGGAKRVVPLETFFTGPLATVLAGGEVIAGVRVRKRSSAARWGYWKFCIKAGDFAKASAAVLIDPARGEKRVLIGAIERPPAVLPDPVAIVEGRIVLADAVQQAAPHLDDAAHTLHVTALRRALAIATEGGR
ncbi:FAD binding domain-containing protein [Microbacteriaceae bacterium K1510]|nr:FAD binding domain-containing protein [Microbacteriaceae bacterium K1510]